MQLHDLSHIPSMGGRKLAEHLYELARNLGGPGAVVECGSWLGASCAPVALALRHAGSDRMIHCYDLWQTSPAHVQQAREQGTQLEVDQDVLPLFLDNVLPIYPHVTTHRGRIEHATWTGEPIRLLIDDVAKRQPAFYHVLRTFGPSWIPGETVVVLMDFKYYRRQRGLRRRDLMCQQEFVDRHHEHFEFLHEQEGVSSVTFRYLRPLDFEAATRFPTLTRLRRLLRTPREAVSRR